jgi:HdeA/HdeB family
MQMKFLIAAATVFAVLISGATAEVVSLEFYKDNCDKFLKSEPSDQQMYLWWATSRIGKELKKDQKTAGINVDNAATSQWLRDYCTAHPTTAFVDAADAAKAQIASASIR